MFFWAGGGIMKKFLIKAVTMSVILVLLCSIFYPIKIAVKETELNKENRNYIICKPCMVTGFDWEMTGSYDGYEGYLFVEGEPKNIYSLLTMEITLYNQFVFYGEFVGEREFENEGDFPVFKVENWSVLYPVKRGSSNPSFFKPYGLTWFDFYHYFLNFSV